MDLEETALLLYVRRKREFKKKKKQWWVHPYLADRCKKGQIVELVAPPNWLRNQTDTRYLKFNKIALDAGPDSCVIHKYKNTPADRPADIRQDDSKYCSQCSFSAQFESALAMHRQLHHESPVPCDIKEKSNTAPRSARLSSPSSKENKGLKLARSSSATRLFERLRARMRRSRTLFDHPEEGADHTTFNDISGQSECTSKAMKELGPSASGLIEPMRERKETFACHLCSFDSDRITVLDRHLLNDHKIGLDNLLKLVMAKTKDGLSDDNTSQIYGIRQPYYKQPDEIIENGEFVIETVMPKIKILKHTAVNTELRMSDIPDLGNCQKIKNEIEKIIDVPLESCDNEVLMQKMQSLNECMCKFVDSTNTIKKVLTKEFDPKHMGGRSNDTYFNLGLGDQDSPKAWERAHSERLERNRSKYGENRSEKMKYSSDSFYF